MIPKDMNEKLASVLRKNGAPDKLVMAKLLENGLYTVVDETKDFCRENGLTPGDFANGMLALFALIMAEHSIHCTDPEEAGELYALHFSLSVRHACDKVRMVQALKE